MIKDVSTQKEQDCGNVGPLKYQLKQWRKLENEGIVLYGLMAEHSSILGKILNTSESYVNYDRCIKRYEAQLTRIEALIFNIIDHNPTKEQQ